MTKEMYKAQYRKEIYKRTMESFREFRHTPIIEVRQGELATFYASDGYWFGTFTDEQKAAFDEIAAEWDAEWNAYQKHIKDNRLYAH